MESLLRSWNVQQCVIDKFLKADIDLEILKGLEDKDYAPFFPTLGSKIRFRCKLQEWKSKNQSHDEVLEKELESSASVEGDGVVCSLEPPLAAFPNLRRSPASGGMRYKPPTHESLRNDSILETIAQNLSADTDNTRKESLNGVDDLKKLLSDSILGCGILSYYESNQCLTKFYEKEVSKIVITHELQCDSRSKITSAKLIALRDLLVQVFPTIEAEKWYSPFKVGPNGERNYASGKLQEQYLYIRKILLGSGLTVSLKRQKGNQQMQYPGTAEGPREGNMFDFLSYDEDSRPELSFVETVTSPGFPNSDSLSSQEAPGLSSYASTPDNNNFNAPEIFFRCAEYDSNLRKRFLSMFNSGRMTDITIACEGKKIKCHQLMLCACSLYFDELLSENPAQHPLVFLKDVKFWELQTIIDFIYTGELKISIERLPSLLAAAECLQIKDLIENLRMPDSGSSRMRSNDFSNSTIENQSFPARTKSSYHQNEGRSRKSTHQNNAESEPSNTNSAMSCVLMNSHDRQSLKTPGSRVPDGNASKRIKLEHSDHHSDYEVRGNENQGFEAWPS